MQLFEEIHRSTVLGALTIEIEVRRDDEVVELALTVASEHGAGSFWHRDGSFVVRIERAQCLVNGTPAPWDMLADARGDETFVSACRWALEQLHPPSHEEYHLDEPSTRTYPELWIAADLAAQLAASRCVPPLRDLALRFSPEVRLRCYALLAADTSGRIAQFIDVCPGALSLAIGVPAAEAILAQGVIAGRPLGPLLSDLLVATGLDKRGAAFVRRAPASVRGALIASAITTAGADINDASRDADACDVWFEWIHQAQCSTLRLSPALQRQFGGFVSKHALCLEGVATRNHRARSTELDEILDYACAVDGVMPGRRSSPARVIRDVYAWHFNLWTSDGLDRSLELAHGPPVPTDIAGFTLEPITTVGALRDEGREMQHCVASYAQRALSGKAYVFRAMVGAERFTVAVEHFRGTWRVIEVAGVANAPARGRGLVHAWVASLG